MPYLKNNPASLGYQNTDTSKAAALAAVKTAPKQREQVLSIIEHHGPISTQEIASMMNRPVSSISARTCELRNAKQIKDGGERGKTEWGKSCILWEAA